MNHQPTHLNLYVPRILALRGELNLCVDVLGNIMRCSNLSNLNTSLFTPCCMGVKLVFRISFVLIVTSMIGELAYRPGVVLHQTKKTFAQHLLLQHPVQGACLQVHLSDVGAGTTPYQFRRVLLSLCVNNDLVSTLIEHVLDIVQSLKTTDLMTQNQYTFKKEKNVIPARSLLNMLVEIK